MGAFDFIQPTQMLPIGAPPMLPAMPKAANNVTATPIAHAALNAPALANPAQMLAALGSMAGVPSEIALRQAQTQLTGQQAALQQMNAQFLKAKLGMLPQFMNLLNGTGGTAGTGAPASGTGQSASSANLTPSASGTIDTGGNWEIANNNPGGLRVPGVNAGPHSGGFQSFDTPQAGVEAIAHQLQRYASGATTGTPITTLRGIVNTWAPPSENDTGTLLKRATMITGFKPDQPLDVSDADTMSKLIEATIRNEQGGALPKQFPRSMIQQVAATYTSPQPSVGQEPNAFSGSAPASTVAAGTPATPAAAMRNIAGLIQAAASNQSAALGAPNVGGGAAQPALPVTPAARQLAMGLNLDPIRLARLGAMGELLGFPNVAAPLAQAYYNSPGYVAQKAGAEKAGELPYVGPAAAATAAAKLPFTPLNTRQQGSVEFPYIDQNGIPQVRLAFQNPRLPVGAMLNQAPNGTLSTSMVPGAAGAIQQSETAHEAGKAAFEPQEYFGPYGQEYLGTRQQLPGVVASPIQAPGAPGAPGLGVGGALQPTASQAQAAAKESPEAAAPTFTVQTPNGPRDLSALSVSDLFPNGQGIPTPPTPPPGMRYGKPSEIVEQIQKDDATRLEGYNKEASENQKIYQDLQHLRDVLGQSLTTSKLAPFGTDLTNIAHGLGMDSVIPKGWDPSNAAEFDKAATDLVFAAVKKLAGQVRVAEIEGYKRANPSLVIPRETNFNVMNDVLATAKWQDARARLANQYETQTGGAPLGAFDARYNQMVPLVDLTGAYKAQLRKLGATFPGDAGNAATSAAPTPEATRTIGGVTYQKYNGQWYRPQPAGTP